MLIENFCTHGTVLGEELIQCTRLTNFSDIVELLF
jgi:hypothetical protein